MPAMPAVPAYMNACVLHCGTRAGEQQHRLIHIHSVVTFNFITIHVLRIKKLRSAYILISGLMFGNALLAHVVLMECEQCQHLCLYMQLLNTKKRTLCDANGGGWLNSAKSRLVVVGWWRNGN